MLKFVTAAIALASSTVATAEWREATSRHFVVYSEGSEKSLRDAVVKLEKYDYVLRAVSGVKPVARPIKLKIYLRDNVADVARSMPSAAAGSGAIIRRARAAPLPSA